VLLEFDLNLRVTSEDSREIVHRVEGAVRGRANQTDRLMDISVLLPQVRPAPKGLVVEYSAGSIGVTMAQSTSGRRG